MSHSARPLARTRWQGRCTALGWYVGAVLGVTLVTVLIALLQATLPPHRLEMVYLIAILACAITGGKGPAILACVLAFLAFDWYFVKPSGNLIVADAEDWLALGLFLIVGVSTGQLAAGLKARADEARRRTAEATTLYELSTAVLSTPGLDRGLAVIIDRLMTALPLRAAAILVADRERGLQLATERCLPSTLRNAAHGELQLQGADDLPSPGSRPIVVPLESHARESGLRGRYATLTLDDRLLGVVAAYVTVESAPLDAAALRLFDAFVAQSSLLIGRGRLAEEEERAQAAADANRLKSIFLASLSHDLRTPLTGIKAAAEVQLAAPHNVELVIQSALNIDRESDRLNRLVSNLLEISRIESGWLMPQLEAVEMRELVGATIERLASVLDDRQVVLKAAGVLPFVHADAVHIERVLVNLIENAVKFSTPGSTITLELLPDQAGVLVRIHNEGAMIPPLEQQRVFDKFYRPGDAGRTTGTGLGLAICKGIVEAHGGRIWTTNGCGGVSFSFILPIAAALPVLAQ